MEGSDWISFASSRMRRTPGDLVLRPMRSVRHVGVGGMSGGNTVSDGGPFPESQIRSMSVIFNDFFLVYLMSVYRPKTVTLSYSLT